MFLFSIQSLLLLCVFVLYSADKGIDIDGTAEAPNLPQRVTEKHRECFLSPEDPMLVGIPDNDLSSLVVEGDIERCLRFADSMLVESNADLPLWVTEKDIESLLRFENPVLGVSESVSENDDFPQDMAEKPREDSRRPEAFMSGVVVDPTEFASLDILKQNQDDGKQVSTCLIEDLENILAGTVRGRLYDKFDFLRQEMMQHDMQSFDVDFRAAVDEAVKRRRTGKNKNHALKYQGVQRFDLLTDATVLKKALEAEMDYIATHPRRSRTQGKVNGGCEPHLRKEHTLANTSDTQLDCVIERGVTADEEITEDSESLLETSTLERKYTPWDISAAVAAVAPDMERQEIEDCERVVTLLVSKYLHDDRDNKTGVTKPSEVQREIDSVAPNSDYDDECHSRDSERGEDQDALCFSSLPILKQDGSKDKRPVNALLVQDIECLRLWHNQKWKNLYAKRKRTGAQVEVPSVLRYDTFNLLERELNDHPQRSNLSVFDQNFIDSVKRNAAIRQHRTLAALDAEISKFVVRGEVTATSTDATVLKDALCAEIRYLSKLRMQEVKRFRRYKRKHRKQSTKHSHSADLTAVHLDNMMEENLQTIISCLNESEKTHEMMHEPFFCGSVPTDVDSDLPFDSEKNREGDSAADLLADLPTMHSNSAYLHAHLENIMEVNLQTITSCLNEAAKKHEMMHESFFCGSVSTDVDSDPSSDSESNREDDSAESSSNSDEELPPSDSESERIEHNRKEHCEDRNAEFKQRAGGGLPKKRVAPCAQEDVALVKKTCCRRKLKRPEERKWAYHRNSQTSRKRKD